MGAKSPCGDRIRRRITVSTCMHCFRTFSLLIATGFAAYSFQAAAGLFDDEGARREIAELKKQFEQQRIDNESRFAKLDEAIKNIGVIQLLNQIDILNDEIAKLRGQIEVLVNQNEQLQKRQRDFYLDLDTRIKRLEGVPTDNPANGALTGPSTVGAAPASTGQSVPVLNKEMENKAYDVGSNLFKKGDFAGAIRAFELFMKDFPASPLVSNAQYWIGICHFNLRDYANARTAQEDLIKKYPDSTKLPDALLAIASIQIETGDAGSARNTLEDIIAKYPNSEVAGKARIRLTGLRR